LLEQCPGEPLCDACLAFACSVSLTEMRVVTAAADDERFRRDTATCASCQRQTTTLRWGTGDLLAADKCAECHQPIDREQDLEVVGADRYHRRCWRLRSRASGA